MPLSEMTGRVACFLQCLGDGLLLRPQGVTVREYTGPIVRSAGQHGGTCRRTDRASGVESLEAQAVVCHRIEIRGLQDWMVSIACLSPAHIVCHHKNDVRSFDTTCVMNPTKAKDKQQ